MTQKWLENASKMARNALRKALQLLAIAQVVDRIEELHEHLVHRPRVLPPAAHLGHRFSSRKHLDSHQPDDIYAFYMIEDVYRCLLVLAIYTQKIITSICFTI